MLRVLGSWYPTCGEACGPRQGPSYFSAHENTTRTLFGLGSAISHHKLPSGVPLRGQCQFPPVGSAGARNGRDHRPPRRLSRCPQGLARESPEGRWASRASYPAQPPQPLQWTPQRILTRPAAAGDLEAGLPCLPTVRGHALALQPVNLALYRTNGGALSNLPQVRIAASYWRKLRRLDLALP
jgi:hypothetical protein